ncbi:MAG: hypothetical protein ABII12_01390 [Planctomycetota bacterium]
MKNERQLGWMFVVAALCFGVLMINQGLVIAGPGQEQPPTPDPRDDGAADGTQEQAGPADAGAELPPPLASGLRKLTPAEINRIRYMELRGMRLNTKQPDRVTAKLPKETIVDFLLDTEGHVDFEGEKSRREFRKLTAPQKLHYIAYYKGAKYADRVEITSDPEVFVTFKKNVLPIVLRGCASANCHSAAARRPSDFQLFKDPKRVPATTYADFLFLSDYEVGGDRMIDRGRPEASLLLEYMLPEKDVKPAQRHPGDMKLKPVFQSRKALGYRRILDWIGTLKHPAEDYGVRLVPRHEPPSGDVLPGGDLPPGGDVPPEGTARPEGEAAR